MENNITTKTQIKNKILTFSIEIKDFMKKWETLTQQAHKHTACIKKLSEQWRYATKATITPKFQDSQFIILEKIDDLIMEECLVLNDIIKELSALNQKFNEKLTSIDKAADDLQDFFEFGNATQCSIGILLANGCAFLLFLKNVLKNIKNKFFLLNARNENSVVNLLDSFNVQFNDESILMYMQLFQYVDVN